MPIVTTWASKISWILLPTRSYIDCMSRLAERPSWTLLMSASSAARSSVSSRRRFVSSNRRAFSRATPMLAARVLRRRSSASLNACCRWLSRATTPITRSRPGIGTPSQDSGTRPLTMLSTGVGSEALPSRSGRWVSTTYEVRPDPRGTSSRSRLRSPPSMTYGNRMSPARSSTSPTRSESTPKMPRIRSPTTSMIAVRSSSSASARPTSFTRASSAFRWRVSSMARVRASADAMWLATKVRTSRSRSVCRRSVR